MILLMVLLHCYSIFKMIVRFELAAGFVEYHNCCFARGVVADTDFKSPVLTV